MWFLPGAHCACGSSPTRANLGYVSHEPTMGYPHPVSTPNCLYSGPAFGATKFSTPFSVGITSYGLGVPPAAYSGTDFPGHTVGRVVSIGYHSPVGRVGLCMFCVLQSQHVPVTCGVGSRRCLIRPRPDPSSRVSTISGLGRCSIQTESRCRGLLTFLKIPLAGQSKQSLPDKARFSRTNPSLASVC